MAIRNDAGGWLHSWSTKYAQQPAVSARAPSGKGCRDIKVHLLAASVGATRLHYFHQLWIMVLRNLRSLHLQALACMT